MFTDNNIENCTEGLSSSEGTRDLNRSVDRWIVVTTHRFTEVELHSFGLVLRSEGLRKESVKGCKVISLLRKWRNGPVFDSTVGVKEETEIGRFKLGCSVQ